MNLETKRLLLRPLCLEDAEGNYPQWLNDKEVCRYNSHGDTRYTREAARDYIQKVTNDPSFAVFAVIDKKSARHIGNVSLQRIDTKNSNAEFAILLGEKPFWNRGYGFEASSALIRYAFETLRLHRVYCGTAIDNTPMRRLASKLGFSQEGILKEAMFRDGRFIDIVLYGVVDANA